MTKVTRIILYVVAYLVFFSVIPCIGQTNISFNSKANNLYWKNRDSTTNYWQQDVHYNIKANIDEKTDVLSGIENVTYFNNAPHELNCIYFHLYQNAFQPNSYLDKFHNDQNQYGFGKYEQHGQNIIVEEVSLNAVPLKTELDNTILKVYLNKPLLAGASVTLSLKFKTYFDIGASWRRMSVYNSYGQKHYNGGHWYPRISVYDRKFGWTADQHLGHEFYGDFGSYDVELNFADNYIVDATGTLTNEEEVLPLALKEKLNIKNFANKPLYEPPSTIIPYDSTKRKTWKFSANNVHDFAFLADPNYRIGEANWNGVKCIALAQESVASRWQNAAELTAFFVKFYSDYIGKYEYPKMIVSDARSGMEYPMLTMDNGLNPDYTFVFAHEIAHNWFFGMVGNNETYRATLDEGFTQFITIMALEELEKFELVTNSIQTKSSLFDAPKFKARYNYVYSNYIENAAKTDGVCLNTHSDGFYTDRPFGVKYRQTYSKGASMLFNLQYVLGDSLFQKAMQNYFKEWQFKHPYFEDFRYSIINYTKVDLNWFFDQWLETNKYIDYSISNIRRNKKQGMYSLTFKRKGSMQMPIDFSITTTDDSTYLYHIPNTSFVKANSNNVLPKWYGWNQYNKKYIADIPLNKSIKNINIDPSLRLADINLLNNSKVFPISLSLDTRIANKSDWTTYEVFGRPDIWWNAYDGLKTGVHLEGSYLQHLHQISANLWFNTGIMQNIDENAANKNNFDNFSYYLDYLTPLTKVSQQSWVNINLKHFAGLESYKIKVSRLSNNEKHNLSLAFKTMFRIDSTDLYYLNYPDYWGISANNNEIRYNNKLILNWNINFNPRKNKRFLNLELQTSAFGSNYDYSSAIFTFKNKESLHKLVFRSRIFGQYAVGNSLPIESSLYLAGGNPESLMENKFTSAKGFIDYTFLGYNQNINHFHQGGGLNLRGYSGYLCAEGDSSNVYFTHYGSSGFAVNGELEFDQYLPFRPRYIRDAIKINSYLFGDIGIINTNKINDALTFANYRADAGIGFLFTIKSWGYFQKEKPFTIRFDLPIFMNRLPAVENDYFKLRWLIGINKSF